MADAIIDLVGPEELPVVCSLYNQVFRPASDLDSLRKRLESDRENTLILLARISEKPVGFFVGFELTSTVFQAYYYGVALDHRRQGIASQLMDAVHSWAAQHEYEFVRFECQNQMRPMLLLAINAEYDIVGTRYCSDRGENLVLLEKTLHG